MGGASGDDGLPDRTVVEKIAGPVVSPAGAGSFDCVRLEPHFAQDDKFRGAYKRRRAPCPTRRPSFHDVEKRGAKQIPPASAALGVGMTRREACGEG